MTYSDHHSYITLPGKGLRGAFQKGWEAQRRGDPMSLCPYDCTRTHLGMLKSPYAREWFSGYECANQPQSV